jgi:hypothetical protein
VDALLACNAVDVNTTPRPSALALVCVLSPAAAGACGGHTLADGSEQASAEESSNSGDEVDDGDQTTGTPSCEVAEFVDPALEQTVRDALAIEDGPVSGEAMLALTTIHVERGSQGEFGESVKLHDLSGLECALNLEELTWEDGLANDFEGVEPLAGLSKLRILVLRGGPLVDLGPLASLSQLELLDWPTLETSDLGPLAELASLRVLRLPQNQITDIGPLAGLANLEELDLTSSASFDSAIVDISALAGLTNLRRLDINANEVVDVSPLAGLAQLEALSMQENAVIDIEPLANLPALHTLDALGNPIVDVSSLASLAQVYSINFSGAQITDLSGWVGSTWPTPMGCANIHVTANPLTEQTIAEDLPQICAANPSVTIWIGFEEEAPFCNPNFCP